MDGGSLRGKMSEMFNTKRGLFAQKWALGAVILPTLEALQLAHSNFTFHRDIKPENLLFTTAQQNVIKVADWGIGKDINRTSIGLTVGGIGTPRYCSPEQWFANTIVTCKRSGRHNRQQTNHKSTDKMPTLRKIKRAASRHTSQRFCSTFNFTQPHPMPTHHSTVRVLTFLR